MTVRAKVAVQLADDFMKVRVRNIADVLSDDIPDWDERLTSCYAICVYPELAASFPWGHSEDRTAREAWRCATHTVFQNWHEHVDAVNAVIA